MIDLKNKLSHAVDNIIAKHAADVDRQSRFPLESINALKDIKLLGAYIKREDGGLGCTLSDIAGMTMMIAQKCASTAMIFAMHHIQVACIMHHEESSSFKGYLKEIADKQLLLASNTSEVGTGGDNGRSIAGVEYVGPRCTLLKDASIISYGAYADSILVTAKKSPDARTTDQVLILMKKEETELTETGVWDTLGMRGTCSPPFQIKGSFPIENIFNTQFKTVLSQTMVPVSHILWSSCWLGIATDAADTARKYVQSKARKSKPYLPDTRLAEMNNSLQLLNSQLIHCLDTYKALLELPEEHRKSELTSTPVLLKWNALKMNVSNDAAGIVHRAMQICGISSYQNNGQYTLAKHLRDIHSASLMINNERLMETNASLLLIYKNSDHPLF
ncbi:acyl-CoA dehydrogenase family protein [Paenibacillus sp. MMS18-CY102]|uniref:acyl-CoA dehydrogenase family protein n=1 Tax=Paenibacillus sp. MMS18-CY102 TaxID=2682849 RepID=UPI0013657FA0|nr:acyl-CoA dehydrogenase family protein [Paenibacillus sp. MMS18-CY102]